MKKWKKALTFSYDDGVTQDIRLIELLNRYGMKGTFNLNSQLLGKEDSLVRNGVRVNHTKISPDKVRQVYQGHEIAVHTLTHSNLANLMEDSEIIRQVEQDRIVLSGLAGYEVVGMAYPGGGTNCSAHAAQVIKENTGIRYARTTICNYNFDVQNDLFLFRPTVYHVMELDTLFRLGKEFLRAESDVPQLFYIWGHSYEFDIHNTWTEFEKFLQMMAGYPDIFYGTNRDIFLRSTEQELPSADS